MKFTIKNIVLLIMSLFSGTVIAFPQWEANLAVGKNEFQTATNTTLVFSSSEIDVLHQENRDNNLTFYGNIAKLFQINSNAIIQDISLGPAFYFQKQENSGQVFQFGEPLANNFNYNFRSQNEVLLLQAKLDSYPIVYNHVSAFLEAGIGGAVLRSHYDDFVSNGPISPSAEIHLQPRTQISLASSIGAGVNLKINSRFAVSIQDVIIIHKNYETSVFGIHSLEISEPIIFSGLSNNFTLGICLHFS